MSAGASPEKTSGSVAPTLTDAQSRMAALGGAPSELSHRKVSLRIVHGPLSASEKIWFWKDQMTDAPKLKTGSAGILMKIALMLNVYDLYRFSLINLATSRICGGDELWKNVFKRDKLGDDSVDKCPTDALKRFIWRHAFRGACFKVINGHTDWVHTIQPFGHCGIATASGDHIVRIWKFNDLDKEERPVQFRLHKAGTSVRCMLVRRNGSIVSGGNDHFIFVWRPRMKSTRNYRRLGPHAGHVTCLAERYDGSIVSACEAGQVVLWQSNGGPKIEIKPRDGKIINYLKIVGSDTIVASSAHSQTIYVYKKCFSAAMVKKRVHGVTGWTTTFGGNASNMMAAPIFQDGAQKIQIWVDCSPQTPPLLHDHYPTCITMMRHNNSLVSGSRDSTIRIWKPSAPSKRGSNVKWSQQQLLKGKPASSARFRRG
eukprot:INCI13355.1.p1 GENE.INCI13355.1~~INCI13355.1.p1  ORF type:complete len:428 (+),score=50.39 INCI13355.1:282-1565(+)